MYDPRLLRYIFIVLILGLVFAVLIVVGDKLEKAHNNEPTYTPAGMVMTTWR